MAHVQECLHDLGEDASKLHLAIDDNFLSFNKLALSAKIRASLGSIWLPTNQVDRQDAIAQSPIESGEFRLNSSRQR